MALDLKIEIFAYDFFQNLFHVTGLLPEISEVSLQYVEECDRDPDYEEVYRKVHINAVLCRTFFFHGVFKEELVDNSAKFVSSQLDFCEYFLGVCQDTSLFEGLSVFERVFATCGFLHVLCSECCKRGFRDCLEFAHSCWAMYFDKYSEEFYTQGGWLKLNVVALSYVLLSSIVSGKKYETARVYLNKLSSAVQDYNLFRQCQQFVSGTCSKKWVKFHVQNYNKIDGVSFYRREVNLSSKEELEELLLDIRLCFYTCLVPIQQADVPLQLHQEWPCEENLNFCASSSSSHSDIFARFQSVSTFLDRERACPELLDVHISSRCNQSLNLEEKSIGPITESVLDASTELSSLSIDKEVTRLDDETCENRNKQRQEENIDHLANITLDNKGKISSRSNSVKFDDLPHLPALFKDIAKFYDIDLASCEQSGQLQAKNPSDASDSALEGSLKYITDQDCETNCKQLADKCTRSVEGLSAGKMSESKQDANNVSPTASTPQQVAPSEAGSAAKKKKKRKNTSYKKQKSQAEQESGTLSRIPFNMFASPAIDECRKDAALRFAFEDERTFALPADKGTPSFASHDDIITKLQSISTKLNRDLTSCTEALDVFFSSCDNQSLNLKEEIVDPVEEGILETNTLVLSPYSICKEMTRLHNATHADQSKTKENIQIIADGTLDQKEEMFPRTPRIKSIDRLNPPALFREIAKSFDVGLATPEKFCQLQAKSSPACRFDANDSILEECLKNASDEEDCETNCKQLGDKCTEVTMEDLSGFKVSKSKAGTSSISTLQYFGSSKTEGEAKKKRKNATSKKQNPQIGQESGTLRRIPFNVFASPAIDERQKNVSFEAPSSAGTSDELVGSLTDSPVTAEYDEPKKNDLPSDNGASSSASHSDIITEFLNLSATLNRELASCKDVLDVFESSYSSQSLNLKEGIVAPIEEDILETNTLVQSPRSIRKEMRRLYDVTREDQSKQQQEKIQVVADMTLDHKEKMLPVTCSVKCNDRLNPPALFRETAKSLDIDLVAAHRSSQLQPKDSSTNPFDAEDYILEECFENMTDEDCEMNLKQLGNQRTQKTKGSLLEGKMSESIRDTSKVSQGAFTSQQVAPSETGRADKKKRKNVKSKRQNPQTEQESDDVIDLLRMFLVLGDKEGIRHVCSTLRSSDKTQSKN